MTRSEPNSAAPNRALRCLSFYSDLEAKLPSVFIYQSVRGVRGAKLVVRVVEEAGVEAARSD